MAPANQLRQLFLAGLLHRDALEAGLRRLGAGRRWTFWCDGLLLILGGALLLASAIFLIAYNWQELGPAWKLGGIQILIVGCTIGAWNRGLHSIPGQALLFCGCVLVGALLATFGQIYQTGADAWELFRAWALLIALWVVAARAAAHWLLLLVIADAWLALYFDQIHFHRLSKVTWPWLALAALQIIATVGLELGNKTRYFTTQERWPRWVLVPAVLVLLCAPATRALFEDEFDRPASWVVVAGFLAVIGAGYAYFRWRSADLFALTCMGFSVAWMIMALALRVLNVFEPNGCSGLVLVGLLVVVMLATLVGWVRRLNLQLRREGEDV